MRSTFTMVDKVNRWKSKGEAARKAKYGAPIPQPKPARAA